MNKYDIIYYQTGTIDVKLKQISYWLDMEQPWPNIDYIRSPRA